MTPSDSRLRDAQLRDTLRRWLRWSRQYFDCEVPETKQLTLRCGECSNCRELGRREKNYEEMIEMLNRAGRGQGR